MLLNTVPIIINFTVAFEGLSGHYFQVQKPTNKLRDVLFIELMLYLCVLILFYKKMIENALTHTVGPTGS